MDGVAVHRVREMVEVDNEIVRAYTSVINQANF